MGTAVINCSGSTCLSHSNPTADLSGQTEIVTSAMFYTVDRGGSIAGTSAAVLRFTRQQALRYKRITSAKLTYYYILQYTGAPASVRDPYAHQSYSSGAALSAINCANYKQQGSVGEWTAGNATKPANQVTANTIDITETFLSNLVNGVYNHIIADGVNASNATCKVYGYGSAHEPYITVTYEDVEQPAPSPLYPRDVFLRESDSTLFSWQFNSSTEAVQASAVLEYKLSTDASYTVVSISSGSHSYMLNTQLAAGTYNWRVKVTNDAGEASGYSDVASFTVIGKPSAPVIGEPENKTLTAITWNADDQNAYDLILADSSGRTLVNVSEAGTAGVYKPNMFLKGTYTVSVRVKNSADLWSEWAYKSFTINAAGPDSVEAHVSADGSDVIITATVPEGINACLMRSERDAEPKPIAILEEGENTYVDKTAKSDGTYTYTVRSYVNGYTDGIGRTVKVKFAGLILRTDTDELQLFLSDEKNFAHSENVVREAAVINYSGREYGVGERGEFTSVEISKRAYVREEDKAILDSIARSSWTYYRDARGNAYPVLVTSIAYTDYMNAGYIATIGLIRVDEEELIINV